MRTAIVDYDSGNLHSAQKAFERVAAEQGAGEVVVTSDPEVVRGADRVVLPGDGAFPACRRALFDHRGVFEAIEEVVIGQGRPFLGICIGMQMMATRGLEYEPTAGFDWIGGEVVRIAPEDPALKVPHMGWNDLVLDPGAAGHPVLDGIAAGDHAYFVHSYHFRVADPAHRLAHCDYGSEITAIVGRDTIVGTQFHPEKSQATGLRLIANFLTWRP
ncbi:imidazole glycerol phosphate synthase subunit HisH [Acidimangrovimonas sediminis]|uniref:imidazole glycerol phosphate synthase subunit HisH n=1 Tax=Acidimangrovimonas sediminis TaxID=2056283 RepID=UPI000C8072F0|nr:imidazole glycerol phosphate synthase subunit HisH [Acidimangrovimonas sediminis]